MFLLKEIQGIRIADQESSLASELRGWLDRVRFYERQFQLHRGRKVQFFLGPEVEGQRSQVQIRTGSRDAGNFPLHRTACLRGGRNFRFPDGRGGGLRVGGEDPVKGQIHFVPSRHRRFRGGGFHLPGRPGKANQVPDRWRGSRILAGGIPHRGTEVEKTVPARCRRGGSAVLDDDDAVPAFPALHAGAPSLDPGIVEAEPRMACLALDDHSGPPEDGVARRSAPS